MYRRVNIQGNANAKIEHINGLLWRSNILHRFEI